MAEEALEAQGAVLQIGEDGSPQDFQAVGRVLSIGGPSGSATEIDVSNLDSTARDFIVGLPDEGSVSVGMNYDPTDTYQELMRTERNARAKRSFRVVMSDATVWFEFSAYITEWSLDLGVDDVVKLSVTLRITGAVAKSS